MSNGNPWHNKDGLSIDGNTLPTPTNPMGHRLTRMPGTRQVLPGLDGGEDQLGEYKRRPPVFGDDWALIEQLENFGGPGAEEMIFDKGCIACGVSHKMLIKRAYLRDVQEIKWICSSCQAGGFIWASDIPPESWTQYQIVKSFEDDTLMRHLSFSPNHQEAVHKPIDDVELHARGRPRKKKRKPL